MKGPDFCSNDLNFSLIEFQFSSNNCFLRHDEVVELMITIWLEQIFYKCYCNVRTQSRFCWQLDLWLNEGNLVKNVK
jgi:hypothetical protein